LREGRRGHETPECYASGESYRPAGAACESCNMHEFPREILVSKATHLTLDWQQRNSLKAVARLTSQSVGSRQTTVTFL
jgi:hypothetical protein